MVNKFTYCSGKKDCHKKIHYKLQLEENMCVIYKAKKILFHTTVCLSKDDCKIRQNCQGNSKAFITMSF